jgi:hypothetical protein
MTVKELRDLLAQFPDDTRVMVKGYEGGWNDAIAPRFSRVQLDANPDGYFGPHEERETVDEENYAREDAQIWYGKEIEIIDAVLLPRS